MTAKDNKKTDVEVLDRASWGTSFEFVLSLLGYAVGISNMLRFPYVCMKNGGGAFLIPYFTCVIVCGVSLQFLEMLMGQNLRTGCISCWDHYAPLFKGMGYCMAILSGMCVFYSQTTYCWVIYYIYESFTWDLPWSSCNNTWNTDACISSLHDAALFNSSYQMNISGYYMVENQTSYPDIHMRNNSMKRVSSTEEFFHNKVLGISEGIETFGNLKPHLVIAHLVGWTIMYLCVCKGVKSVGKVVYVTAIAPYVLIVVFLIRAALLPGSLTGVMYFLTPNFQMLTKPNMWIQAFVQVLFSLGLGWGGVITMASYNKFNHPLHREALLIPLVGSCTSLLCGFLVFSVAGFLAHVTGAKIDEAVSTGPGLAFISYPEAAAHLPGAPIWAILFFLMLMMTGADTQFVTFETCVSALTDEMRISRKYHIYIITGVTLLCMLTGLVFLSGAGMYIYQVIDWYLPAVSIFLFAMIECLALMWMYGYNRFYDDINAMIGFRPIKYLLVPLWGAVIPIILLVSMVWSLVRFEPPRYGSYVYPSWVPTLGWFIGFGFTLPMFIVAAYKFYKTDADTFRLKLYYTFFPGHQNSEKEECAQIEAFL